MNVVTFDSSMLHAVKQVLRQGLPCRSGHLSEAIAACLGFRSHAALLTVLDAQGVVTAVPDPMAALRRLKDLGDQGDERVVLTVVVQALVHGAEHAQVVTDYYRGQTVSSPNPWLDLTAKGCRTTYRRRLRTAWLFPRLAPVLARLQPLAKPNAGLYAVDEGRLVFDAVLVASDPRHSDTLEGVVAHHAASSPVSDEDDLGMTMPRPVSLKSLDGDAAAMLDRLEAEPPRRLSELEGLRQVCYLIHRIDDADIATFWNLQAFACRHLPLLAASVCRNMVETCLSAIRDDVLSEESLKAALSIIGRTSAPFGTIDPQPEATLRLGDLEFSMRNGRELRARLVGKVVGASPGSRST